MNHLWHPAVCVTGTICTSPCSKQADYKQWTGKEHSAGQTLLTWADRNKVKVKHFWKIYFWTPQLQRIWENMHQNSSKLKPDENDRPEKKRKIKSCHTRSINQGTACQNLWFISANSLRGLEASLPKDMLKALTEAVAPAPICHSHRLQSKLNPYNFFCLPDLNLCDISWTPRKPRNAQCQLSGFWNSSIFIQMSCISHTGSTL